MAKQIHILLGTKKGAFILDGDANRRSWSLRGPFCEAWPMNHVIADPATGTINVRLTFPNPDRILVPGQYVSVILTRETPGKQIVIPQSAVQENQAGPFVLIDKIDPPPLKWSALMYGFEPEGGSRCRRRDTIPKRLSRSCAR